MLGGVSLRTRSLKEWRTWWETKLRMLKVEVDDLGQRMHLGRLEVTYEFCQTLFEFGIYPTLAVTNAPNDENTYKR
jgi:hypothetical protein